MAVVHSGGITTQKSTRMLKRVTNILKAANLKSVQIKEFFKRFHLEKVRIGTRGIEIELSFLDNDKDAAWELYIEMLTRIVTQPLPRDVGDEQTALDSIHTLFPTTRTILRGHGRDAIAFSKVAIPILNQVVRPFTTKWHKEGARNAFGDPDKRKEFRDELDELLKDMRNYNRMLAEIAGVEDLTDLEQIGDSDVGYT